MIAAAQDKPAVNPWIIALVVSIATFMEVLDTTITNVSISHIAGELGASQDESTWVLTSYLVANGIILPLSGWLADLIGRKKFFMLCIGGFTAASFACGAANSLEMLVFFRLIQGFCGGGLQPTQQSIVLDAFPPEKRGAVFGITGITLIAAPIIGPALGGWITDNMSWRWVFFINVPVGAVALFLVGRMVHDHTKATGVKSIDYIGVSLIALGLGALQIMLDKGQQKDWFDSNFINFLAIFSCTCLVTATYRLLRQKDPIVHLRLFKDRAFALCSILIFFTGFVLYGSSALLPLLVQSQFGYNATTAGLILSPSGFVVMFLMPVAGKLVSKIQARYLVIFGLICCAIGMWMTSYVTPQSGYDEFVMMRLFQVVGLPFLFIPVSTLAFTHITKKDNNKASALFSLCRNLGGSIGIAIAAAYVSRHQNIHQNYMSSNLTSSSPAFRSILARYTQSFLDNGYTAINAAHAAMGKIYQGLINQSYILAYNDTFRFMTAIMIFGIILAMLLPSNDPHAKSEPGAAH